MSAGIMVYTYRKSVIVGNDIYSTSSCYFPHRALESIPRCIILLLLPLLLTDRNHASTVVIEPLVADIYTKHSIRDGDAC